MKNYFKLTESLGFREDSRLSFETSAGKDSEAANLGIGGCGGPGLG